MVDIALGIGQSTGKDDLLQVTEFLRFVSLDGVPWNDPVKKAKLYIGTAMNDFIEKRRAEDETKLKPTTIL